MMQSAVSRIVATLEALMSAVLSTSAGVRTPSLRRSPYSSVTALKPKVSLGFSATFATTTPPFSPAFSAMVASGTVRALRTISMPAAVSYLTWPISSAVTSFFLP